MPRTLARAAAALLSLSFALAAAASAQVIDPTPPPCGIGREPGGLAPYRPPRVGVDVAVLPFSVGARSGEPGAIGDGMARLLAEHLDSPRTLRGLAARWPNGTVGSANDMARIGRDLRARLIVAGTVVRSGDAAVATLRVVRASDGTVVVEDGVDFAWDRLPDVEARFASAIRRAAGLTTGNLVALTTSAAALEAVMMGDVNLRARDDASAARAASAYAEAVRLDPRYAGANVRLAAAWAELAFRGPAESTGSAPGDALVEAKAAIDRAIARVPQDPWAWAVRGRIAALQGKGRDARAAFARARAIDPDIADVLMIEGRSLLDLGDAGAAEPVLVRAAQRMSQSGEPLVAIAELRLARGDVAGACRALNGALAVDRRNPYAFALRGVTRARMREMREAWGDGETAQRLGRRADGMSVLAIVDAAARDTAGARERVRALLGAGGPAPSRVFSPWEARFLSRAAAATGDARAAAAVTRRSQPIALARFPLD